MTMTPREIQEKQFHDAFRGYSHEEVDLFIDQVAEAYDQIYRDHQTMQRRVEELEAALNGGPMPQMIPAPVTVQTSSISAPAPVQFPSGTGDSEDMLKRVLMTAQESADKAVQTARARAQALIEESEAKARRIQEQAETLRSTTLEDAQRRASETLGAAAKEESELKERIEGLKVFERDFRTRLGAFVRSQLELLEAKPVITSGSPPAWDRPRSAMSEAAKPAESPSWLSMSEKPAPVSAPAARKEPVVRKEVRVSAPPVDAGKPEPRAVVRPEAPKESAKEKSKAETKSIRELFWGDD